MTENTRPPTAWIGDLYLARAVSQLHEENKKSMAEFALTFQFAIRDTDVTDASYPLVSCFFLYNPFHETPQELQEGKDPLAGSKFLIHTDLGGAEKFSKTLLETFTSFYEDIISPHFYESRELGVFKGEIPDENNYRASLIQAVEDMRKKDVPIHYQILGFAYSTPKGFIFFTEDEILYFPFLLEEPEESKKIVTYFFSTDEYYFNPLLTYRRFSLPERLLV